MRAQLDKQTDQVQAMFDRVAPRYDLMNNLMAPGQVPHWRKHTKAAVDPQPHMLILDLAAGTASSSRPLADAGAEVVCCDLSHGMLVEGKKRHPDLSFVNGDALALPFPDETFDVVTITFGLRNIPGTVDALREMRRVTKPGGRLVVCEFSTPTFAPFAKFYRGFISVVLPRLAKIASTNAPAYAYLAESIIDWPAQRHLGELLKEAGWSDVAWKNLTGGIVALHRGRR